MKKPTKKNLQINKQNRHLKRKAKKKEVLGKRKMRKEANIYQVNLTNKKTKKEVTLRWCTYETLDIDNFLKRFKIEGKLVDRKDFEVSYKKIQEKK